MTNAEHALLLERIFDAVREVRGEGGKEYGDGTGNAFSYFEQLGAELDLSREQVLWVLANKHRVGIRQWLRGHRSQREDVRGRIKDFICYLTLLWGMIEESESNAV